MEAPKMDDGNITIKKARFGKWTKTRQRLLRQCEHKNFIACLVGFYSCRWKSYQPKNVEPGHCCCGMGEGAFFTVLVLTLSLWFTFLYMWVEAKNDYHNFDGYAYEGLGFWFRWSTVILILASFFFSYFLFLMILAVCLFFESQQLYLHWSHKAMTIFFMFVSVVCLTLITFLWRRQWNTFYLSFQITAPFLHISAIFTMIVLAWPVALHFFQMHNRVLQVLILGPYLSVLLFLLFIPLGMHSPCIREKGTLGPKPQLIGHRGAPMVAPENTEMAFLKTIYHGGMGLETDVTISLDGVPFLMHDRTLKRTTNIDEVFPEFVDQEAAFFPWAQLEKLNAGKWFFKKRPFFGMPPLKREDRILARSQKIFKFVDFVTLANKENKYIIFDLYRPPKNHPYRDSYIERVLEVLLNDSPIRQDLVLWLPGPYRYFVHSKAPGFQQVSSSADYLESLKFWNIVKINVDYRTVASLDIRTYEEANITTNLWVVSEPWLFSLVWCYGVHSVTTNSVHSLNKLKKPFFLMTPQEYRTMWILTDVVSIILICAIFGFYWWKGAGRACCKEQSSMKHKSGSYNKIETELNRMPTVA
ncbi:glycerophosphodiester phosphodiesterase domain-containing protein 4 isoform X1 [Elgaria multicarinata webbii]|uniref:glycerophosphodiester phosphodiesterase domain-containing protein 4 isoform X1 n=1 Tax=Elgaria multicarinata webbii TaxID=159646 RepID=UPI002FCD1EF7